MKNMFAVLALIALAGAAPLVAQTRNKESAAADKAKAFVGTWEAKFHDKTFFVVTLQLENEKLTGTLRSGEIHVDANGEVDRVEREAGSESAIHDVMLVDKVLSFKNKAGEDIDSFEMKLTGRNEATLRPLLSGAEFADVPALQPFRMMREIKK